VCDGDVGEGADVRRRVMFGRGGPGRVPITGTWLGGVSQRDRRGDKTRTRQLLSGAAWCRHRRRRCWQPANSRERFFVSKSTPKLGAAVKESAVRQSVSPRQLHSSQLQPTLLANSTPHFTENK